MTHTKKALCFLLLALGCLTSQAREYEGEEFIEIAIEQIKEQLDEEQKQWQPYELPPYGVP